MRDVNYLILMGLLRKMRKSIVITNFQVQKLLKQLIWMLMMTYPLLVQIPVMKSKETNTNEMPSAPSRNLGIVNEIDQIVKKGREAGTNQLGVNSSEILLKLMGLFKIVLVVDDCGYYCVNYCILIKLCSVQRNYFSETWKSELESVNLENKDGFRK